MRKKDHYPTCPLMPRRGRWVYHSCKIDDDMILLKPFSIKQLKISLIFIQDSGHKALNLFYAEIKMLCSDDKTKSQPVKMRSISRNTYLLSGLWIGILFFFTISLPITAEATDHFKIINCDVHHGTCTQKLQGTDIILNISPKPVKAMTDLKFTITLTGKQGASEPFIDLGMPGMKMGPNRVFLKSNGKGVYSGTGTVVRCPSGKRIWKATVTFPDKGSVEFIFDVIY